MRRRGIAFIAVRPERLGAHLLVEREGSRLLRLQPLQERLVPALPFFHCPLPGLHLRGPINTHP